MNRPRLHLIAPAGSCRRFLEQLQMATAAELIALVQEAVGPQYRVTGDEAIIEATEDESAGGRRDDAQRIADLQRTLGDPDVAAMVAIRGGSWLTRILPQIDFSVLDDRAGPIAVFGFSELTTLVNIIGTHARGLGVYDIAPAFLAYGLARQRRSREPHGGNDDGVGVDDDLPVKERLRPEFIAFFRDVVSMIEGKGSSRQVTARVVCGQLPDRCEATFVGGNLSVLATLLGSPYRSAVDPAGRWLVIEDFNERPYRLDRLLAQLTLAGCWDRCEGILLGDFHDGDGDLVPAVEAMLPYHLPRDRPIPVLTTADVGHVWPMAPLPLHRSLTLERLDPHRYSIRWPGSMLRVV